MEQSPGWGIGETEPNSALPGCCRRQTAAFRVAPQEGHALILRTYPAILRHVQHKEKLASALFKPIESLTPGIVPFLTDLRARGIKIGYATNTERANLESKFVGTPLPELADFIATATDVTYPKPHPEIYLKAAQVLGAAASECLVFEDSPPGITAGQTAGMKVVMLRTDYNQMIAADDVAKVITDFRELTAAAALSL